MDAEGNPIPLAKQRVNGQDIPLPNPNGQELPRFEYNDILILMNILIIAILRSIMVI